MKNFIASKLMVLFLTITITLFILLETVGLRIAEKNVVAQIKEDLYRTVTTFSSNYLMDYYYRNDTQYQAMVKQVELLNTTKTLEEMYGIRIWLVSNIGVIVTDSQEIGVSFNIRETDLYFFESPFRENVYFPEIMSEPALCTILPIIHYYDNRGYLVMSISESVIQEDVKVYMDVLELLYVVFLVILAMVLLFVYWFAVLPVKKITGVVKQISVGNFKEISQLDSLKEYPKLVQSVQYMGNRLKSTDDAQRKFISNVSHDFRSPLTSIKGYVEAMKDGTIPVEMQDKYLDVIIFETERLTKLTSNLLQLNGCEDGIILYKSEFDVNQMIRQIAMSFEGTFKKKKLMLNLVFSQKEQLVYADMEKIQQVVYNLMDNAIKFSNSNSSIYITTEEKGNKVVISIKDNGIGIEKECMDKIWNRFYKVDISRGKDKKGAGLGLAILKEIITAHGETISVNSKEGVETEFVFSLPKMME